MPGKHHDMTMRSLPRTYPEAATEAINRCRLRFFKAQIESLTF